MYYFLLVLNIIDFPKEIIDLLWHHHCFHAFWHRKPFGYCHSLRHITLPVTVKKIGSEAFEECIALTHITLPVTLQSIGTAAFRKCAQLQGIIIPPAVREISSDAFRECSSLVTVDLSVSLKNIGGSAFAKCVSLREVNLNSPTPPTLSRSAFKDVVLGACRFLVPKGCRSSYLQDKQWQKMPQLLERQ